MSLYDDTDNEYFYDNDDNNIRIVERAGKKIVEIGNILFSGKRKIDWDGVEEYLKKYVGESYVLDEMDNLVYIGKDFPEEYTSSRYSKKTWGTIAKAKANISQAVPQLIQTATNIAFQENKEQKHSKNAKYGWYRCTIRFTLPITDDKGNNIGQNNFQGRMIIRHSEDGKKYLYDIIDIKKET